MTLYKTIFTHSDLIVVFKLQVLKNFDNFDQWGADIIHHTNTFINHSTMFIMIDACHDNFYDFGYY